jgi:hypothetical protein
MKKIYLSLITCGVLGIVLLNSNAGGPASNGNRATGAPGDGSSTCVTCHNSGGAFGNVTIDMSMKDANGNVKTEYIADSVYEIKITVSNSAGTPDGYGFSMICLDANDNNYNGWANASSNAQLSTSAGRNYVEHDGISSSNEFTVDWTAPSASTGDVTFYVGANAVNGADGNSGDKAALDDFTISETEGQGPNAVNEIEEDQFAVFPNPTNGLVTIEGTDLGTLVVLNSEGQLIQSGTQGSNTIDVSNQPTGFYLIQDKATGKSQKIFKL